LSAESSSLDGRCTRCCWRDCLCSAIPRLETRTRIIIVRHRAETFRSSNTGRLAHLALVNSELVDYGGVGAMAMPSLADAWLVFPEGEPARARPVAPPAQLVVLDATWSQARRMFRKLDALRGLPILRLPVAAPSAARLRAAPAPGRVSTIEAVAMALRLVEGDVAAAQLDGLFQTAVARARASGRRTL
jgi:DTW domain-containing protein YfiP